MEFLKKKVTRKTHILKIIERHLEFLGHEGQLRLRKLNTHKAY